MSESTSNPSAKDPKRRSQRDEDEQRKQPVLYSVRGATAVITLDSPYNRNAISPGLVEGLRAGLRAAESDPDVRSVRLEHTGPAFCAGADLRAVGTSPEAQRDSTAAVADLLEAMLVHPKPIVAVITGHVRAGGMGLAACADAVFAGPRATFGLSEVRIGVAPALVSAVVMPRLLPRAGSRWLLGGEAVPSDDAAAAGFITESCEDPSAAADQLEAAFAASAPGAMAEMRKLVNAEALNRLREQRQDLLDLSVRLFMSAEAAAGLRAFNRKQPPPWQTASSS